MPHTPLPRTKCVYNGRSMVTRVEQKGGKIALQQESAMAPLPAVAKKPADPDLDKKAMRLKLMAEVSRNL